MALVARHLSTDGFGGFSVAWSLLYTISGAVLSSAEPELTRLILGEKWQSARTLFIRACLLIVLPIAVFSITTEHELDGAYMSNQVLGVMVILLMLMLIEVLVRSIFASAQRRLAFGLVAPSDSVLRSLILVLLIVVTEEMTIELTFVAMLLGTLVLSAGLTWITRSTIQLILREKDNEEQFLPSHRFGYGYLLLGTTSMTGLVSGVPVIVGIMSDLTASQMGVLGAALMIARVPLILIMGFESVLVQEFDARLRASASARQLSLMLMSISALAGGAGFLIGFSIGPSLVKLVVGQEFIVTGFEMALFGSAIGFMLGAIVLTPLNIALGQHARIAGSWGSSLILFIILVFGFGDNLTSVALILSVAAFLCAIALSITGLITKDVHKQGIS